LHRAQLNCPCSTTGCLLPPALPRPAGLGGQTVSTQLLRSRCNQIKMAAGPGHHADPTADAMLDESQSTLAESDLLLKQMRSLRAAIESEGSALSDRQRSLELEDRDLHEKLLSVAISLLTCTDPPSNETSSVPAAAAATAHDALLQHSTTVGHSATTTAITPPVTKAEVQAAKSRCRTPKPARTDSEAAEGTVPTVLAEAQATKPRFKASKPVMTEGVGRPKFDRPL